MGSRAHLPMQVPIEAYGNGGFRFGGLSHRGSLLCLPTGHWDWTVSDIDEVDEAALEDVLALRDRVPYLILGTGAKQVRPSLQVREACERAGIWVEAMDTGAAARTYNIVLAERRPVAAALIAVA